MVYLTVEEVLYIYEQLLGPRDALRDRHLLESAVARPQQSAGGQDAYPTLIDKAAALMHSLILNHAFVDGNKRLATYTVAIFLINNGRPPRWDPRRSSGVHRRCRQRPAHG